MSEKKDIYGKVKNQARLTEKIGAQIPGFSGYKEDGLRRESDKLVPDHLYKTLSKVSSNIRIVLQKVSDSRILDVITDLDRFAVKFDRVTERVNHASYGYTEFFDVVKIKEENLDRMMDLDNQLFEKAEKLTHEIEDLKSEVTKQEFETAGAHVRNLSELVDVFDDTLDHGQEVILGVI